MLGQGKGVTWEGLLAQQVLYEAQTRNERLIPVLFDDEDEEAALPMILRPYMRYRLQGGYEGLYRRLTRQPAVIAPPLGQVRALPPHGSPLVTGAVSATPFKPSRDRVAVGPLPTRSTGLPDRPGLASETPDSVPAEGIAPLEESSRQRDENVARRASLEKLLASLFDTDGLKRWLVLEYPHLQAELPSSRLSLASYVHEAVEMLGQHIDLGRQFFEGLIAARQGRANDIRAVQDAWVIQDVKSGIGPEKGATQDLPPQTRSPYLDTAQIRDLVFREAVQDAILARKSGDFPRALIYLAGLYEAMRICWTRAERQLQGEDMRYEDLLPAFLSTPAGATFRQHPRLYSEPTRWHEGHGPTAESSMGFDPAALMRIRRLVALAEQILAGSKNIEAEVRPEDIDFLLQTVPSQLVLLEQHNPDIFQVLAPS